MEISDNPSVAAAPAPASRLFNRNFYLLWQGQTISQLGNQAFMVAMTFWTMEKTGSASVMGLMLGLSVLPGVLLSPFGGTFADRHSRIRILVVCDLLSGVGVMVLTGLLWAAPPVKVVLAGLFFVAVLGGIVRSFFMPAIQASIPNLVPRERLAAANSLNQFSIQSSLLLGQAAGGILYQLFGAPLLFLFDGLSFLFAGASSLFISLPPPAPVERQVGVGNILREFLRETGSGLRYVLDRQGLRNFVLMAAMLNFFFTPVLVLLPFYVKNQLAQGSAWYGYLLAAMSAGSVAGFGLAGMLKLPKEVRGWLLLLNLILGPALFGVMGSARVPLLALSLMFLAGLAMGMVNIYLITLLQISIPNELRGRVLGLLGTLGGSLIPIGMALAGWVGDLTHKNVPLIFGVTASLSALSTILLALNRECRAFLAQES